MTNDPPRDRMELNENHPIQAIREREDGLLTPSIARRIARPRVGLQEWCIWRAGGKVVKEAT